MNEIIQKNNLQLILKRKEFSQYDRTVALRRNQYFVNAHKIIVIIIFGIFLYFIITDQSHIEHYNQSLYNYIMGICVLIVSSHLFTAFLLWIPAMFLLPHVWPEIHITDDRLVYLGGSISARYFPFIHQFFVYLLGIENSQKIMREDIVSVQEIKVFALLPLQEETWRRTAIAIIHNQGEIITGAWLYEEEKIDIIEKINSWKLRTIPTTICNSMKNSEVI